MFLPDPLFFLIFWSSDLGSQACTSAVLVQPLRTTLHLCTPLNVFPPWWVASSRAGICFVLDPLIQASLCVLNQRLPAAHALVLPASWSFRREFSAWNVPSSYSGSQTYPSLFSSHNPIWTLAMLSFNCPRTLYPLTLLSLQSIPDCEQLEGCNQYIAD